MPLSALLDEHKHLNLSFLPINFLMAIFLQQGAWGVINDRQSEDPPGTFDGVPGYVIARIDEVTLCKRVLNDRVLLLSISSFYLSCAVCCAVM